MKTMKRPVFYTGVLLLALPLLAARCSDGGGSDGPQDDPSLTKVAYEELTTAIPNPERGFYYPYDFKFENGEVPKAINTQALAVNRTQNRTLFLLEYFLRDFIDKPLSDECLALIRANMQVLRDGGG